MIKSLFTFSFIAVTAFYSNQVQSQVTVNSGTLTNPPATDCANVWFTVAGDLAANNYPYMGSNVNIVGFNITIDLDYLSGFAPIYTLTPFSEDFDFGMLALGTYSVTVNGILDGNLSSTLQATFDVIPCCPVNTSFSPIPSAICLGETVNLLSTSTGGINYNWYINNSFVASSTSYNFTPASSGTYDVKLVVDDGNCADSSETTLQVVDLPVVDLGFDTTICIGDTIVFDATISNGSYEWQDASTNPTYAAYTAGVYGVTVTDAIGCTGTDTVEVMLIDCSAGIAEQDLKEIRVYPNPSSSLITIEGIEGEFHVSIYSMIGELILDDFGTTQLNVSALESGLYLIQIHQNGSVYSERLIVK